MLNVVFRVDASTEMGSGHVMRCLTLANVLASKGASITFLCKEHKGNLGQKILSAGFGIHFLSLNNESPINEDLLDHSSWLGSSIEYDAIECQKYLNLQENKVDWLIVDHYALDYQWEKQFSHLVGKIMVIDDLADRKHHANLILDQNLGRTSQDYADLVNEKCRSCIGPEFALLRNEFSELRDYSLDRRQTKQSNRIMISMGGVDKDNYTGQILSTLSLCDSLAHCRFIVILGSTAPHLEQVVSLANSIDLQVEVKVDVNNMASLMADCDIAIGAGGVTALERACLGLPSICFNMAQNQTSGLKALESLGASQTVGGFSSIDANFCNDLVRSLNPHSLELMSVKSALVTDGLGATRLAESLLEM